MKAAQINSYGGPDVLQAIDSAEKPKPGPGEVLIEVHSASANPFDWKVREGYLKEMVPLVFPATLGGDLAGIITEAGEGLDSFKVGDEVYGQANPLSGKGSFAEFTPVKSTSLALKPKTIDFATSAAVPLAGSSAHQAITEHIDLKSGQKILIHGGAGGIGSFAVQIAKHIGAYVAVTAAAEDMELAKSLGADEVIDYKSQDFTSLIKDYDAVFDTVGGETAKKSYQVLKSGGVLVSMTESPDDELAKKYGVKAIAQQTKVTTERLTQLAGLVDDGSLKVFVDKIFPLEDAGQALGYLQAGGHRGKVVIKVK